VANGHNDRGGTLALTAAAGDGVSHVGVVAANRPGAVIVVGDYAHRGGAVTPIDVGRVVGGDFRHTGGVGRIREGRDRLQSGVTPFGSLDDEAATWDHARIGDGR